MNTGNVYGDISPRTAGYATKELLKRAQPLLITERFGQVDPQGQRKTKTRKWRRYNSLPRAMAPLAEGIPPTGHKLTFSDVQVTLEQYGSVIELTDVIEDTHEDPVLDEMISLVSEQAAETVEQLRYHVLRGGTNVFYANGVTARGSVASPPTRGDIRLIVRSFSRARAHKFTRTIRPSANYGTEPVAPAFWAFGHTDLDSDLRGLTGFVPVEKYAEANGVMDGEIGKLESVRFVLTSEFEPWYAAGASGTTYLSNGAAVGSAAAADVYPLIFVARDSYAIVPLSGKNSVTPIVLNPNKPSASDPLGQKGSVGWKTYQATAVLNQQWMARLECAVTATPN